MFEKLKIEPKNVLFSEEKIEKQLLKKQKISTYDKNNLLLRLINISDQKISDENIPSTRVNYVEKREIDRSTLYSFDGPFQLIHVHVGNLEFLRKSAISPRYVLLVVDLYSSKVYVYPMSFRKLILQMLGHFYDELKHKRNKKTMRLQVDNQFQQVKIKDLNEQNNVEMFTTAVRGGNTFAAEQKIRELKSRIEKLNAIKMKVMPTNFIFSSAENMNSVVSENMIEAQATSKKIFVQRKIEDPFQLS